MTKKSKIHTDKVDIKSVSNVDKEGKEATIRVRKITNGFVLCKEIYDPNAKKDMWKTEETFYEYNPLAKQSKTLAEIFQS